MNQLHPIIQQAIAPMFHAQIAQLTQEQRREIDAAMLADKQANGYWQRAKAAAMCTQLQQNGRES